MAKKEQECVRRTTIDQPAGEVMLMFAQRTTARSPTTHSAKASGAARRASASMQSMRPALAAEREAAVLANEAQESDKEQTAVQSSSPNITWDFGLLPLFPPKGPPPLAAPGGLLQRKLEIGAVDDPLERETDAIADKVMRMPDPALSFSPAPLRLSRKCASCEKEDDALQLKEGIPAPALREAPPSVITVLRSPGQPLGATLQREMGQRFGRDFSKVRVHLGTAAERSAREVRANAYTVGKDIVFGAGQFAPASYEGRRLLAHELTHVAQQGGIAATIQRQPKSKTDQEREAAIAEAQRVGSEPTCTTAQLEAQSDAESAIRLKSGRENDKTYALSLGYKDKALIEKRRAVSPKLLSEIATKVRFFSGEARAAYLRSVGSVVIEFGDSDAGSTILEPCAEAQTSEAEGGAESKEAPPPWATSKVNCDAAKHEYEIEEEDDPTSSRCMDIRTDSEFTKNYFDNNLAKAVGYSVPGTTWENVTYDRFEVMLITYKNGKSEYFVLNSVGNFHYGRSTQMGMLPSKYVKRTTTGLVYPLDRGQIYLLSEHITPNIISLKNGLKYQTKDLQGLYNLLQVGGIFASIMGFYALGVDSFKTSISAFERTGPARLPGRPLPGIGVKGSGTTTGTQGGEIGGAPKITTHAGEGEEGEFKGAPKGKTSTEGGEGGTGSKRTSTVEEGQSGSSEKTLTAGGGAGEYRPLSKNPDIGVMEVRDDGSVSIVTANRQDSLEPGVKVETHIKLANHPAGLGPITAGAARYRFYMQNGKVYSLEPLSRSPQTPERVGQIQRALQRNRLLSDGGTRINLAPGTQDDALNKTVFPR